MRILGRALRALAGGVMILMGMAMVTGTMTTLAYILLVVLLILGIAALVKYLISSRK